MEHSFQKIYAEMYARVVRQAAFLLGDTAMAEDVAQEAFVRLHGMGLSKIDSPSSWLFKVTNNLCYDYLRSEGSRRRREEKVTREFIPGSLTPAVPSAEMMALNREELKLVHKALEQLQPRDRIVLLLKFSGFSYEEIAGTLNMNKGSVGTVLARARERFKQEYQSLL